MNPRIALTHFATDRCNARCGHCFNGTELNRGARLLDDVELAALGEHGFDTVSLSGGEPFLRADLARVAALLTRGDADLFVPTNGLQPERTAEEVGRLLGGPGRGAIVVSVSLDGPPRVHDRFRGVPGGYDRAVETLRLLAPLKSGSRRLRLKVGTVLCDETVGSLSELLDAVLTIDGVDFHDMEILRGEPLRPSLAPPSVAELDVLKPAIFRAWARYAFFGRRRPFASRLALALKKYVFELHLETLRSGRQPIPCLAGERSVVVGDDGAVRFCELREPIGSVREASLPSLLSSETAAAQRRSIARGDCRCTQSCQQQRNVLASPRVWPHVARYAAREAFGVPRLSAVGVRERP